MPKFVKRFKKKFNSRPRRVRLPLIRQPRWKKMMGIASQVMDQAARLPGPLGLVAKSVSSIKNLINVETHFNDVVTTVTPDSVNGTVTALALIAQGDSETTRTGNKILAKSLTIKGRVDLHASATNTIVRLMIILDKQNGAGTAPTNAQILTVVSPQSLNNLNFSDRFVKIFDQNYVVNSISNRTEFFNIHKDLSDMHVLYDGTAADQASAAENHMYFCALSTEATNVPNVLIFSRFNYFDN